MAKFIHLNSNCGLCSPGRPCRWHGGKYKPAYQPKKEVLKHNKVNGQAVLTATCHSADRSTRDTAKVPSHVV